MYLFTLGILAVISLIETFNREIIDKYIIGIPRRFPLADRMRLGCIPQLFCQFFQRVRDKRRKIIFRTSIQSFCNECKDIYRQLFRISYHTCRCLLFNGILGHIQVVSRSFHILDAALHGNCAFYGNKQTVSVHRCIFHCSIFLKRKTVVVVCPSGFRRLLHPSLRTNMPSCAFMP